MADIFYGLTRGVPGIKAREMQPPVSSFEKEQNIIEAAALRYSPDKLFLGLLGAEIKRDAKSGERFAQGGFEVGVADDRHVITIAGSRAGKGRSAIIPNMLRYSGSVLAIDPKGELALATAKVRAKQLGQKVCILDPFGTTIPKNDIDDSLKEYRTGFNPLAMMRFEPGADGDAAENFVEDAILITDALVVSDGKDPHWDESARTFIEGVILEVASADRFEGRRNLVTVRDLIAQGDVDARDEIFADDVEGKEKPSAMTALKKFMEASKIPSVRRAAADFFEKPEKERGTVLSTARRHIRTLNFPAIEASLKGDSFDLSDLKKEGMTVYLCLPGRHIGTCGRWLRLFINMALQAMERTTAFEGAGQGQTATGNPVLFVLDEFATLGHMRQIEDAAGQIAGFGVKLWPILQDLGQLKALYKERWETFMGNAGILQFFGNNDLTTLEWVSKRLGSTTIEQLSGSSVTPDGKRAGGVGESYAPRTTAILEPDEVGLVFGRADTELRQLIFRAGFAPMILQRAYYDKHDSFKGLRQ